MNRFTMLLCALALITPIDADAKARRNRVFTPVPNDGHVPLAERHIDQIHEDCEGLTEEQCYPTFGDGLSAASVTIPLAGELRLCGPTDWRHRYDSSRTDDFYREQWQHNCASTGGWVTILTHKLGKVIDDLFDIHTHHGAPFIFVSDGADGNVYVGGGFATPRIKVGRTLWDGDMAMLIPPPLVNEAGEPCIQYGVNGCDLPVPPLTHSAPIQIDSWQLAASPQGDANGWVSWLMFDAAGTHIATAEYDDILQLEKLVPIIRDMLEFKGDTVYLSQHGRYMVSNRIVPGLRYSQGVPFEPWAQPGCNWETDHHCEPVTYTDPGEYHWDRPNKYQFAAMLPPFSSPDDVVGYHAGYVDGEATSECVRSVTLDSAERYIRHVKAWGNHAPVNQNSSCTIATPQVNTGVSLGIADPRHLLHYTLAQLADCDRDGIVGGPDFICFVEAFRQVFAEGYYPEE